MEPGGSFKDPNWVPKIRCKNFGEFTFSLAVAKHTCPSNPCTNHLEFCPACPREPVPTVHWTHPGGDEANPKGMAAHWAQHHPEKEMPAELKEKVTLSEKERNGIIKHGKEPPKKRKRKAQKEGAAAAAAPPPTTEPQQAGAAVGAADVEQPPTGGNAQ